MDMERKSPADNGQGNHESLASYSFDYTTISTVCGNAATGIHALRDMIRQVVDTAPGQSMLRVELIEHGRANGFTRSQVDGQMHLLCRWGEFRQESEWGIVRIKRAGGVE